MISRPAVSPPGRPAPAVTAGFPPEPEWLAAAERTVWIPAEFAAYDMPIEEAAARLRAPVPLLARLLRAGMPSDGAAEPKVDANDVVNLGLELGWHGTLPVVSFRGALRWLMQPLERLLEPQVWRCQFAVPAGEGAELALPCPEVHGGRWTADPAPPSAARPRPRRVSVCAGATLRGTAHLVGRREPVRATAITRIAADVLSSGVRWAKLPLALQICPAIVSSLGYATCVSVSLTMADELRREGFTARTRRGWLIAPISTGHSWVEVLDEDGRWKVIDPVLVLLRRRLEAIGTPARNSAAADEPVPELVGGLFVNRVLAVALPGDAPLCIGSDGTPVEVAATFRRVAVQGAHAPVADQASRPHAHGQPEERPYGG